MPLSSSSSTRSPSLPTQEPTLPAPGLATAGTLQPPQHLAAPRRTAQAGASASTQRRAAVPPRPATAAEPATPPGSPSADGDVAMTLASAEKIANDTYSDPRRALASNPHDMLFKYTLKTYKAAQVCSTQWLESGDETHQAAAQTLSIKASLLDGLYLMRRHHKEWNLVTPVISLKALRNALPLFQHALGLCQNESSAVRFPVEGLEQALAHLEKQAEQSTQWLEAAPASVAHQLAACRDLHEVARQLQDVLAHGPASRKPPGQRSFKAVLIEPAPAGLEPASERAGPAIRQPSALRYHPQNPKVRRESRPLTQGMETVHLQDWPTPAPKAKPRHPGATQRHAAQPTRPSTRQPAAAERPADPAAEAAVRLRHEQLAGLRGALAPLRNEAHRLHDAAMACASSPAPNGLPWARQASEFAAWQTAAQADHACAHSLAAHADELGLGPRDPAVRELRREFHTASRDALERATQAAESALAVFLQAWDRAPGQGGQKRAGAHSRADLAVLGRELQQQWLEAPLRPHMPVLGARMAVFDACEDLIEAKTRAAEAGDPAATRNAAELLCQATADARHASEEAKGVPGTHLRAFHAACKNQRDELLCKTVRLEFEAAEATHAKTRHLLQPLLDRSRQLTAACDVLLMGDPLPAVGPGTREPQTSAASGPAAIPESDRGLIATARHVAASLRAQREQAIQLPPDAPQQPGHDLQAVLGVLRQSEMTAECVVATLTSFHGLNQALARTPLNEQPVLMRSHVRDMRDRSQELQQLLLAQEDMPDKITDAKVGDLVERSCALLCHDLRQMQTMLASLETLARLLDARVSADHACRRLAQGSRAKPGPAVDGSKHQDIAKWAMNAMQSIEGVLEDEQAGRETAVWKDEKGRLDQASKGLRWRIACDAAMIEAKYFLQALAIVAPIPDAASRHRLDIEEMLLEKCLKLSKALADVTKAQAQVIKDLETQAAPSPRESECHAQIGMHKEVHEQLRTVQRQLLLKLAALRAQAPANTSAGNSRAK